MGKPLKKKGRDLKKECPGMENPPSFWPPEFKSNSQKIFL